VHLARNVAIAVLALNVVVFLGALAHVRLIASLWPGLPAQPSGATVAFILLGGSLLLWQLGGAAWKVRVAQAAAIAAALVGLLTLVEYLISWDTGLGS
jgi:hypothetical protein